ncbi:hypothetical protein [Plantactinospora sp. KBS50]|uniref:hypothetical protein n=1 Tax=Plantactinospora sp. KBS50 TaxID=2024580 RepID=UPI0012FD9C7A|nr:hypothetical protein [Plantactinospora sp. KBS50]
MTAWSCYVALNRALMEVRFLAADVDDAVRGSSHLAEVHARVVDAVIDLHRAHGDAKEVESWNEWRNFEGRGLERRGIVEYLLSFWVSLDSEELRLEALRSQLHPFIYGDDDLNGIYRELEDRSAGK